MRKVTYFSAGTVADFTIPDDRFQEFLKSEGQFERYGEDDLTKARDVLDAFMARARATADAHHGGAEILAACFIWNFFNTNPEEERLITDDIVIIDLDGDLNTVEYAAARDIQIEPGH
ncbi:hypothetical protein [Varunaivibrio sulfuroxidans]|uniref:Uncharacterized protein n=1 Tax=Varunaivibrio sulfuroxidans TaxID=1773489 RepID=A0A4R3J7D1_9PROT|nr:hypothetical protein [Varunaivibrio sulfuroxidans]TCS60370.1 hypothetical protein EDD55_11171 [Varunaivibrio sulfuroxidans]WES30942.1 hypothetical protein P3M64_00780 [Varunaivibrio sulfuroxidans]